MDFTKKRNKIIFIIIALTVILILFYFCYLRFYIVRTDYSTMNEVELMARTKVIIKVLDEHKEFRDGEMLDILRAYSDFTNIITVDDEFDHATVKQQYRIDRNLGWMPVGMPEFQIFKKTD